MFMLEQHVLKFNDSCVSGSSPKTDLETMNYLNLEIEVLRTKFYSIVLFRSIFDIPSLINLFIFLIELKNIHSKHQIKEHRCKFKINKEVYSNVVVSVYDVTNNKSS